METGASGWLQPTTTGLIAHRCGGSLAPENSLAGLDASAALGVRAVEFDVMLSADGIPVLIHDETLDRTTSGHGPVAAQPLEALQALSCARGWGGRFAGERVPTLEQTLQRCRQLDLLPNIEIKPYPGQERATGLAAARIARSWEDPLAAGGVLPLLSSFSEVALMAAREILPHWPAALLVESVPADWPIRMQRVGATSLHCSCRQAAWDWLDSLRAAGFAARCYTVNDLQEAEALWARGVAGVFSDRIDLLARAAPPSAAGA